MSDVLHQANLGTGARERLAESAPAFGLWHDRALPGRFPERAPAPQVMRGVAAMALVDIAMHPSLTALLCLTVSCASRPSSRIMAIPQPRPTSSCPNAPIGDNANITLVILSELGDTLRAAQVRLTGRTPAGPTRPLELNAPSAAGVYQLGPLPVGDYQLTVADSGRRSAHIRVRFCADGTATLQAILVPVAS